MTTATEIAEPFAPPRVPPARPASYRPGPHRVALFAAAFTWPLLFVGGLVTTYRVGMAVPDWPATFGINMFLYNFWNAAWGVFIEHGHRLYGSAVGFACIVLAVWFTMSERRGSLVALGWFALLAVIAQGVLGGLRVRWNSTALAAVHGCTAQAFFGLMVALCVLTGRLWFKAEPLVPDPARLRRRSVVNLALIYAQVVLGALLRHYEIGLEWHSLLALGVLVHTLLLYLKTESLGASVAQLRPSARAMALIVGVQFVLGIVSWWILRPFDGIPGEVTTPQALIRTAHQANAALLLAAAVVYLLRAHHTLTPVGRPTRELVPSGGIAP
jgi:cytochrome c oxidase assembly protein subunit 15